MIKPMDSEQQEACMTLQINSCGLEEAFLSVARDLDVTDEDLDYAESACNEILRAVAIIRADT